MAHSDDPARAFRARATRTFNSASSFYGLFDHFSREILTRTADELSRAVPMGTGTLILEVFCATGLFSRILAGMGARVFGADLSPEMVRHAEREGEGFGVDFLVADAADLPFPDDSFDLLVAARGLHAMPESVRDGVVREIYRVSRGHALFIEPKRPISLSARAVMGILERLEGGYEDYRKFVEMDFVRYLTGHGFSCRTLVPYEGEHIILCGKGAGTLPYRAAAT